MAVDGDLAGGLGGVTVRAVSIVQPISSTHGGYIRVDAVEEGQRVLRVGAGRVPGVVEAGAGDLAGAESGAGGGALDAQSGEADGLDALVVADGLRRYVSVGKWRG